MSARWFQIYGQESAVEARDPSKTFIDLGEGQALQDLVLGHGADPLPITPDEELLARIEAERTAHLSTDDQIEAEAEAEEAAEANEAQYLLAQQLAAELAPQPTPWEPNLPLVIGGTALATLIVSRWLFRP